MFSTYDHYLYSVKTAKTSLYQPLSPANTRDKMILQGGRVFIGIFLQDGGCTSPGDVAKAFGAGADFVMLGGKSLSSQCFVL